MLIALIKFVSQMLWTWLLILEIFGMKEVIQRNVLGAMEILIQDILMEMEILLGLIFTILVLEMILGLKE